MSFDQKHKKKIQNNYLYISSNINELQT